MTEFEASVREIAGLTTYTEGILPRWMRERILAFNGRDVAVTATDGELIDVMVRDSWLGHWGVGVIEGQEVTILEHLGNHQLGFEEAADSAHWMNCGFVLVEPSELYDVGGTTYLTESLHTATRRKVNGALARA